MQNNTESLGIFRKKILECVGHRRAGFNLYTSIRLYLQWAMRHSVMEDNYRNSGRNEMLCLLLPDKIRHSVGVFVYWLLRLAAYLSANGQHI